MIKSLCILGGGTSGMVSALMLKKAWPELDVTVIESDEVAIIGVGEGSTEHWKKFMDHVGIDVPTLIRETGATFKIGIKFTNWQGDGKHYFHSLAEQFGAHSPENGMPFRWIDMIGRNVPPSETVWELATASRHIEPLHDIIAQYHFDTFKLNAYFHRLCKERNITIINQMIDDVIVDEQGYVAALQDTTGNQHAYDFYIDCSGFKRIIGSKIGAKWLDCTNQLPMNSAIAFPTGYTEDIPSYTEATAMNAGWVWRIPTQERYGNGYVFCDAFINETQALDEVQQHYTNNLGITETLQVGKRVKFGAGHVDQYWIKNCVMAGLSGIFVEPMEASSIGTTIQQIFILAPSLFFYERGDVATTKKYNSNMRMISENIVDFIQLHYFNKRDDTEFWRWCKNEIQLTDFNAENLEYFKNHSPNPHFFHALQLFSHMSFTQVMHGLDMYNHERIKMAYDQHLGKYTNIIKHMAAEHSRWSDSLESFSHREAIEILKTRYETIKY